MEFDAIEQNLKKALKLAKDCYAAYQSADDVIRRLFNQAFFEKIYVHDDGAVTHDLAEPFGLLLDPSLPDRLASRHSARDTALPKTRQDQSRRSRNDNDLERIEVGGSNFDTVVPPEGFEPSTSRSGGARSNPLSYEGNERQSSIFRRSGGPTCAAPLG